MHVATFRNSERPAFGVSGRIRHSATRLSNLSADPVNLVLRSERLLPRHRLRSAKDYAAVRTGGVAFRGRFGLLLALPSAGETSRVGFIASKRGVGGAVQRNRARRRLREIVRRRWARVPQQGFLLVFIASRATLSAPHQDLASEVELQLARAGALAPVGD